MDTRRSAHFLEPQDQGCERGGVRTRGGRQSRGRGRGVGRGRGERNAPAPVIVPDLPTWSRVQQRGQRTAVRNSDEVENPAVNVTGGNRGVPEATTTQVQTLSITQMMVASMFEAQVQVMKGMLEMMKNVTQMVQARAEHGVHGVVEGQISGEADRIQRHLSEVDRLRKLEPPKFHGDTDVAKAHTWIREMTMRLDTLGIPDERRGTVASYFLKDKAYDWWYALGQRKEQLTWASLERLFMQHFVPNSYRTEKAKEFLTLVQIPDMSVAEYSYKFEELYEFGKMYAPDEGSKAERFRQGLMPNVGAPLVSMRVTTYDEMREEALLEILGYLWRPIIEWWYERGI
ncbi:uncharacterized protein LOC120002337 isoform X2 [Tripterygium wilfordii]|nr:uncharacterized protein LOC120002337 isoform X2 [Tripterygium wilfordii]